MQTTTKHRGAEKNAARTWRFLLLALAAAAGLATTGCATTGTTSTAYNDTSSAPDPAWYQSSDNPFRAD